MAIARAAKSKARKPKGGERRLSKEAQRRQAALDEGAGRIESGVAYHIAAFCSAAHQGSWALRNAERQGLPIRVVGNESYVIGDDFIEFLKTIEPGKRKRHAKRSK